MLFITDILPVSIFVTFQAYSWGLNANGQLGQSHNEPGVPTPQIVMVSGYSLLMTDHRDVVCWYNSSFGKMYAPVCAYP